MNKKIKIPSQDRAINTRNTIIYCANRLFLKNGYKKTNTIIIAKAANVSIGIVYSYFKDKNELLELWLNSLLEKCDEYFYNQFKLLEYEVELPMIISNILEKLTDEFFSSPIIYEKDDEYLVNTISNFYKKAQEIFVKSCYDAEINIKHQNESSHLILNLIKDYNYDLSINDNHINFDILKDYYVKAIISIMKS